MNGAPNGQQKLPHWLASTVNRAVDVAMVDGGAASGFLAHVADGFMEIVQRIPSADTTLGGERYTHVFVHIQHICRIAPSPVQWRPNAGLAVPEKPKLLVP